MPIDPNGVRLALIAATFVVTVEDLRSQIDRAKIVAKQFASRLSLIAFATATIRGLLTSTDFEGTLKTALLAAASFYGLGLIFGELARRVVEENARSEFEHMKSENARQNQ